MGRTCAWQSKMAGLQELPPEWSIHTRRQIFLKYCGAVPFSRSRIRVDHDKESGSRWLPRSKSREVSPP